MSLLVIIALVVIVILWFINVQRRLVSHDELCQNSMSQIGVQQQSRWDALGTLADVVKSYNEHEYKTLMDVISMRKEINGASSAEDANAQEQAIGKVVTAIKAVAEQYPELKANENYIKLMEDVRIYEDQVRTSRMVYNDTVTRYNRIIRQFPDSVVASFLHFSTRGYLETPSEKKDMPKLNI